MEETPIEYISNETRAKFFVDDFFNNATQTGTGNETTYYQCTGATYDELKIYSYFSFWIGGIFQLVVCLIGLVANTLSIPVLRARELYTSTFNRFVIHLMQRSYVFAFKKKILILIFNTVF